MGKAVPIVNYLRLGEQPQLVARRCGNCGALWFDRRRTCGACGRRTDFEDAPLDRNGTVQSFTIVHRAARGVRTPYVSAVVRLDGGGYVKANLVAVDPDPGQIRLGMPVQLVTFVAGTDDEGNEAVAFGFTPARAGNGGSPHA